MNHPLGMALAAILTVNAFPVTDIFDGMPPYRFQGNTTVTIRFVDNLQDPKACGSPPPGKRFLGCVRDRITYMPNPCPRGDAESFARILCHELAHTNGWPRKHGP